MSNKIQKLLYSILTISAICFSQEYYTYPTNDTPLFEKRALGFFIPDSTYGRLDVYLKLYTNSLHFEKKGSKYSAQVEISILVLDLENSLQTEKVWTENYSVNSYNETFNPNLGQIIQRNFRLPLEKYKIKIIVNDLLTKKIAESELLFNDFVNSKNNSLGISSILILKNISQTKTGTSLSPNLQNVIDGAKDTLQIFYELYNYLQKPDTVLISYVVISPTKDTSVTSYKHFAENTISQIVENIHLKKLALGNSKLIVTASIPSIPNSEITNSVEVISQLGSSITKIIDLNKAIEQTKYIAKEVEFKEMMDEKNAEKKKNLFESFWKKRDKTPQTEENEFFNEYYQRVEYSNKTFSHFNDGWKTDMGMVFILIGPPNNIERHPFEINTKPFEVWFYYLYNRQIVFVDQSGFGDYRLTSPIWDLLQRMDK